MSTVERVAPQAAADSPPSYTELPGLVAGWWPVAASAELADGVVAARLADTALAAYRDASGSARVLLDRCPHRRMPLSLGRITEDGLLQCGYHGWSFNGVGRCERIPNFRPDERPSRRMVVDAFATAERDGLVLVHSGGNEQAPLPAILASRPGRSARGQVEVRSPHAAVMAALLFNPGAALGLGPLLGAGDEVVGPVVAVEPDRITVVRERLTFGLPRLTTFDAPAKRATRARIEMTRGTGLTSVTAELPRDGSVRVLIGATPVGPYRTVVRWQLQVVGLAVPAVPAAVAAGWAVRSRAGRTATTFANVADVAETTRDPALSELEGDVTG